MLVGREESGACMREFGKGNAYRQPCKKQPQPFWHAGFNSKSKKGTVFQNMRLLHVKYN